MIGENSAELIKKSIVYYFLLAYCPPNTLEAFLRETNAYFDSLIKSADLSMTEFYQQVLPEVCHRIVCFHEDTRYPDENRVEDLIITASVATEGSGSLEAYQEQMNTITSLPERAAPDNRLHRKKGCAFCAAPCQYGFFSLVSEPRFNILQDMFNAETAKPSQEQSASRLMWSYTRMHLEQFQAEGKLPIQRKHLGNMSYCLLMLSMAKSRKALPERHISIFQEINQRLIQKG